MRIIEKELKGIFYFVDEQRWNGGKEWLLYPLNELSNIDNLQFADSLESAKKQVDQQPDLGIIGASSLVYTLGNAINNIASRIYSDAGILDVTQMDQIRQKRINPHSVKIPLNTQQTNSNKKKRIKGRRAN